MNKYVIDTQALIKFLNGMKVINENIDLIAGTVRHLNLPLITNDPVILKSSFVDCVK